MAAITVNAASAATLTAVETRALQFGMAAVNRTRTVPLANIKEYVEYRINQEIIPQLVDAEGSTQTFGTIADKFKSATDAQRAAAIAALG